MSTIAVKINVCKNLFLNGMSIKYHVKLKINRFSLIIFYYSICHCLACAYKLPLKNTSEFIVKTFRPKK